MYVAQWFTENWAHLKGSLLWYFPAQCCFYEDFTRVALHDSQFKKKKLTGAVPVKNGPIATIEIN